jgi:glycosyltransferase involved in cell wall biosynthesis
VRVLIVSQFWPGADDPDYGVFVAQVAHHLRDLGHEVGHAAVDRRGAGRAGDAKLLRDAVAHARRHRPDVVFGHFLFPAGAAAVAAARAARVPLVLMAHGQDVRNAIDAGWVRRATRAVVRRADTVIFNSAYLRDQLPFPAASSEIIDCGVDLAAFTAGPRVEREGLEPPVFLFAGSLIERKNVVRLRDAFAQVGRGTLVIVGDGPLRGELEGRDRIVLAGRVPFGEVPGWMASADVVCLPSEVEPFGQVLLEALACGRSVVATKVGGPPEFVVDEAGALVDPFDVDSIRAGLERVAVMPVPNPAARAAAERHDARRQAERMAAVLRGAVERRRGVRNP